MTKRLLRYAASAVLSIVFLLLAFRGTDVSSLYESLRGANYWWIVAMVLVLIASHLLRAWRWQYLLDPIKKGIGLRNLFSGVMIGFLMNNVLPRAGELARPYSLGKLEGISKSSAFGTIVVERIMDMVVSLLLIAMLPLIYDGPLRESFPWLENATLMTTLATVIFMAMLLFFALRRDFAGVLVRVVTKIFPARSRGRIEEMLHSFLDGFLFVKRPGSYMIIFVLSFFIWFLYIVMMYVAFWAFGLQSVLGFRAAVVLLTISNIGVILPTPGSTGTYHFFVAATLTKLFFVPGGTALSYATVTHAAMFIGTSLVGLYYLLRDHIRLPEAVTQPIEETRA